ncbi:uncharacterized protein LOC142329172 [Lycorma delicatula]|uniref:uncharacterized protein LOC142329172 n=1 Tax=Lycorma delicatula TaxID=130591 RepID=UPI003F50FD15
MARKPKLTPLCIQRIKQHPILYDFQHPEFLNTTKKRKTWDNIASKLQLTGNQLKGKWKNIKDGYVKYLRSLNAKKLTPAMKTYRQFPWAKQMEHFQPYLKFRNDEVHSVIVKKEVENQSVSDNAPEFIDVFENGKFPDHASEFSSSFETNGVPDMPLQIEIDECFSLESKPLTRSSTRNSKRIIKRPNSSNEYVVPSDKNVTDRYARTVNDIANEFDATELLFLAYAKTIKKFSPHRQVLVKFKFAQIMMEEELQQNCDNNQ